MGMRIRTSHGLTFVFKQLHPAVGLPELCGLLLPSIHHQLDGLPRHVRQGFAVIGRETNHSTLALLGGQREQGIMVRKLWCI